MPAISEQLNMSKNIYDKNYDFADEIIKID